MNILWCFVLTLLAISHQPSLALHPHPAFYEGIEREAGPRGYPYGTHSSFGKPGWSKATSPLSTPQKKQDTREPSKPLKGVVEERPSATPNVTTPTSLPKATAVSPSPQKVSPTPTPAPVPAPRPDTAPEASASESRTILQPDPTPVLRSTPPPTSEEVDGSTSESVAPTVAHAMEKVIRLGGVGSNDDTSPEITYPSETLQGLISEAQSTSQDVVPVQTHQAASKHSPSYILRFLDDAIRKGDTKKYSRILSNHHQVLPRDEADNVLRNIAKGYNDSRRIDDKSYDSIRKITREFYPRQKTDTGAICKQIDGELESMLGDLDDYDKQIEKLLRKNPQDTTAIEAQKVAAKLRKHVDHALVHTLDKIEDILRLPTFMTLAQNKEFQRFVDVYNGILRAFESFEETYVESGMLEEAQTD